MNQSHLYSLLEEDFDVLRKQIKSQISHEDFLHLKKVENWGRLCSFVGLATAWVPYNFLASILISVGNMVRWTIVTHHISHKGYDSLAHIPKKYHSTHFAKSWRRFFDWPDWIAPDAWHYEHNILHHYRTGEVADPDLVEENLKALRESQLPAVLKLMAVFFFMFTWKFTYYAPNTLLELQKERIRRSQKNTSRVLPLEDLQKLQKAWDIIIPKNRYGLELWLRCYLPYALLKFIFVPALFLPISADAAFWVLIQSLLAEIITNIYTFVLITPNHAGADLYRFDCHHKSKGEFYYRQITGSANYHTGHALGDFFQGYLNYQIEHHLWPDIPILKYKEFQTQVQMICKKHGVPYVQESIAARFIKLVRIAIGKDSMRKNGLAIDYA